MKFSPKFNRVLTLVMALCVFGSVSLKPKDANAIVMVATGGSAIPGLIVIGASLVAATGAAVIYTAANQDPAVDVLADLDPYIALFLTLWGEPANQVAGWTILAGEVGVIVGIVILDDSGAPQFRYAGLTPEVGSKLGLSSEELTSFNGELPEINSIVDQISSDLQTSGKSAANRESLNEVASEWAKYRDTISPASFSAIQKLSAKALEFVKAKKSLAN